MVRTMFKSAWEQRVEQTQARAAHARKEIAKIEKQIDSLVDRIVESENDRVTKAYESRIAKMEREKIRLEEAAEKTAKPKHTFEELFELSMSFLSKPLKIWDSGDYSVKRMSSGWHLRSELLTPGMTDFERQKRPYHSRL